MILSWVSFTVFENLLLSGTMRKIDMPKQEGVNSTHSLQGFLLCLNEPRYWAYVSHFQPLCKM